jgi:hypothetical protein
MGFDGFTSNKRIEYFPEEDLIVKGLGLVL